MEKAFDAKRRETGHFGEAMSAAVAAAEEYDKEEALGHLTAEQRSQYDARERAAERAAEQVEEIGLSSAIHEYAKEHGADLGGEYVQLVDLGFSLLEAATLSFDKHDKDKVRAALEVGNAICSMSAEFNKPFLFMIIFGAMLTELAACPEAQSALQLARTTIPGVQV